MAGERATTIRFSDPMYQRLEAAGEVTGLPINSIVVVACLEWLDAHQADSPAGVLDLSQGRWGKALIPPGSRKGIFPFDRFSVHAKEAAKSMAGVISVRNTSYWACSGSRRDLRPRYCPVLGSTPRWSRPGSSP